MSEGKETASVEWKVVKEISVGDVLAVVMAFISVIYAYTTLDKRITLVEEKVAAQVVRDNKQDEDTHIYQQRIDAALTAINAKLDRLIERGHR